MNKQKILQDAFRILGISDVSESKLKSALEKRGYSESEILETIEFLKTKKFLNDSRYCLFLIEKFIKKKKGIDYIRLNLLKKGIPENIIDETLAKNYPEELEYKIAKQLLTETKKPLKKALSILNTRGFSQMTIEKIREEINEQ